MRYFSKVIILINSLKSAAIGTHSQPNVIEEEDVQWVISLELDQIRLGVAGSIRKGRTGSMRTCVKHKIYLGGWKLLFTLAVQRMHSF